MVSGRDPETRETNSSQNTLSLSLRSESLFLSLPTLLPQISQITYSDPVFRILSNLPSESVG